MSLSENDLMEYESILARENPDLMKWLIEKENIPEDWKSSSLFNKLIEYTHSNEKTFIRREGNQ